jgi:hypothetical protein
VNWRRGLFRLWIVGSTLFVLAVAFVSYSSIKSEFDAVAKKPDLAADAKLADEVYRRFYSDMPREEFDKKSSDPKVIARLEAIIAKIDTSRPLSQWTDDELVARATLPDTGPSPSPWATLGMWAAVGFGVPLVVLALGASLVWALSGFAARRKPHA